MSKTPALLHRIAGAAREPIPFELDGRACTALEGDTVLSAVLTNAAKLRESEFGGAARAGFCLMGACQDCWVRLADGERLRACTTFVEPGMRIRTGT
ncbi:MAG TPA: (2Fe-2S)-binding protein [Burkholderiaceae bacterium]|nr:(2Fe-2S)-binding protein [Burkholderiaceae bacterium]